MPDTRILIVDDDQGLVLMLAGYVQKVTGYRVDTAANGVEALELMAKRGPYVVVLIDRVLFTENGLALACSTKQLHPNSTVVVMSGFEESEWDSVLEGKIDYVLSKPFHEAALCGLVRLAARAFRSSNAN
jgi:DNA-binding NtrC family response regulator